MKISIFYSNLVYKLKINQLNQEKLFENLVQNKNKGIEINEFSRLIRIIDTKLERNEVEYIFNKIVPSN